MGVINSIYKWLYTNIGGRMWTYILRDIYHQAEWVIQTFWFALGAVAAWIVISNGWPLWWLIVMWAIYTFGYINGHLHWGTKYIEGQGKD